MQRLGAYVFGHPPDYRRAEAGGAERALKALPTLEVVAVGEISAADLLVLDGYAEGGPIALDDEGRRCAGRALGEPYG